MKKTFFLLSLAASILFISCKKENLSEPVINPTVNPPVKPPVKPNERLLLSAVEPGSDNYTFQYNADKTLKSYTQTGTSWIVTYEPGKMILDWYSASNVKKAQYVIELSNGIAQKMTRTYYQPNGAVQYVLVTEYAYNAKGLLVYEEYRKDGVYDGCRSNVYDDNNDGVLSEVKDKNGASVAKIMYEFDLSLMDKFGSFGQLTGLAVNSVFPKRFQHMVKKYTSISPNGTNTINFSYTTDAQGYPLTCTAVSGNLSEVTNYTWQ